MEEAHSVNSPRRVLSFSKRKKQKPGFNDSDSIRTSPFRASQVHGPKPSEVYGFVGSISTVVATVIFLTWAYVPDRLLESIGIHYYPSRYWVLAMPTYLMVTLVLALAFYIGLNFIASPPPTSLNTLFDEYSREPGDFDSQMEEGDERPIDPISDIDITRINDLMFNSKPSELSLSQFNIQDLMGTIDLRAANENSIVDLSSQVHQLPCCIRFDGPSEVSHYFKPQSSEIEIDGVRTEEAHFRGRKLQGATISLPSGYSGFVVGQASNINANGKRKACSSTTEEKPCWEVKAKFDKMTYWNHDNIPSKDDTLVRSFHWFSIAETLHKPVNVEDLVADGEKG